MFKTLVKESLWLPLCLMPAFSLFSDVVPKKSTHITFNGVAMNAYFNDGDTFKILDGSFKNTRVRIAGFNTLETYGPVHEWAKNNPHYLFDIANLATEKAQAGPWTCTSDGKKDTYGRMLATCDDLALALIQDGLAHAYSVDDSPANQTYLSSQKTAKAKKLGIWKYGIPSYIITSLHSAHEGASQSYNRLISTVDGHTKSWKHKDTYESCQRVCIANEDSCMIYVPFEHRYGSARPDCLL